MNRKKPGFAEMEQMLKVLAEQDSHPMDAGMEARVLEAIREEYRTEIRHNYKRLAPYAAAVAAVGGALALLLSDGNGSSGLAYTNPVTAARRLSVDEIGSPLPGDFCPVAGMCRDELSGMEVAAGYDNTYNVVALPVPF